ncbi:hypothetical protein HDV03_000516 [Kappamyces sp. JEL0829]|nr:hypothetical protein HDV03_000516 [Kappamyces sp. JEL0829]
MLYEIKTLLVATHSNMAACYLKLNKPSKCIQSCDLVLGIDPKNGKAMFRKGQALHALHDYDHAQAILKEAVLLAPNDTGIRSELQAVKDKIRELEQKSTQELKKNLKF